VIVMVVSLTATAVYLVALRPRAGEPA